MTDTSKTAHTPGPWSIKDRGIWDLSIVSGGTVCHISNKGEWFPNADGYGGRSHNKMMADARLIAAAPDYFEAVAEILEAISLNAAPINPMAALRELAKGGEHVTVDADLILALLDAQAKATGAPA